MFKSGFIGIIGRPNVGKSTLLNGILGEKLAIITSKPQTTRNRIVGIFNREDAQFIFVDTPGIHSARTPLNRLMVRTARETFTDSDVLLLVVEGGQETTPDDLLIIESLKATSVPKFLILNKIDLIRREQLLPQMDAYRNLHPFAEMIPISALTGDGIPLLLDELWKYLPEGPRYFPEDMMTDSSERFVAAEIVREKILLLTHKEIPYSAAVVVDAFKEDEAKNLIRISATINVEKDSQKAILIGKKGSMLKEIGTQSRLEMETFFAARIYLELFVRVRKDWTKDPRMLREFGYSE
ncbi:GTP-binding protein Era [Syntrophus gentianae]|uniref:GTPase Era n=1 Tax=Syntrophus gentianae TaxID=43775 RepID=A0A1H7YB53_9BACT|nr:GTPase Era [Syntrophus gentianae]SEM43094.1 GTP-binding protein Era [Syntrophus gentianae]